MNAPTTETAYPLNDLYPTIQGEGVLAGTPMLLVRLQGCPVGCVFCDTKETWERDDHYRVPFYAAAAEAHPWRGTNPNWTHATASEIAALATSLAPRLRWALLTGGEPALYDLGDLSRALVDAGFKVALETSGTEIGHISALIDHVCVSPKWENPGGRALRPAAIATADEIKAVIGSERDIARLDALLLQYAVGPGVAISLQPMSLNRKATDLCVRTALDRGWRVSLQQHKYLEVR